MWFYESKRMVAVKGKIEQIIRNHSDKDYEQIDSAILTLARDAGLDSIDFVELFMEIEAEIEEEFDRSGQEGT